MKQQIRIVRISFFIGAILIVSAFLAGFYYGNTQFQEKNLLEQSTRGVYTAEAERNRLEEKDAINQTESVESMNTLSPNKYYLKQNGNYLSVYRGNSESVYFDTDLKVVELPEELQEKAINGIEFDDLEEVYGFLENYSS